MKTFTTLATALGLAAMAHAHMEMIDPAPFKSKNNPNAGQDIDYSMTNPLSQDGSDFPCKGFHSLMGTDAGAPTADWTAGQSYSFTISGGAAHGGGSCQASLSFDGGSTWSVIHSYIGNCPAQGESTFDFTVPSGTPSGEAIFAWTWFNQIGNREMYMNCAAVNIAGGAAKRELSGRPSMFVANTGNGCSTVEGADLEFPEPGPDVSNVSSNTSPPSGNCPAGNSGGSPVESSAPPADTQAPSANPPSPTTEVVVAPVAPTPTNGGVFLTAPPVEAPTSVPAVETTSVPAVETTSAPAVEPTSVPAAAPTTLVTSSRVSSAPVVQPTTSVPVVAPTPPVDTPTPSPVPTTPTTPPATGAGAFAQGEACTEEGMWNCVSGSQFQRCASGQWSALMAMAAGTTCTEGQSETLQMFRKRVYGQPLIRA